MITLNQNDNDILIEEFLNQNKQLTLNSKDKIPPFKNYQKLNWKWDISDNNKKDVVLYSNDPQVVMFHPSKSFGTSAVRCDRPLSKNAFTYWQITLSDRIFGTSIMIGIGTKEAKLSSIGYLNLLGIDANSWGLSHKGYLWHNNKSKPLTKAFDENKCVKIGCLFDGFKGRLAYFINDVYQGVAFDNIKVVKKQVKTSDNMNNEYDGDEEIEYLYPMISSTISQCIMKLDFCYQTFPTLQEICRSNVIKNNQLFNSIKLEYPFIPSYLRDYLET